MDFAGLDDGDDYDETRMKVINGRWLFSGGDLNFFSPLPPRLHSDQFSEKLNKKISERFNDHLMN